MMGHLKKILKRERERLVTMEHCLGTIEDEREWEREERESGERRKRTGRIWGDTHALSLLLLLSLSFSAWGSQPYTRSYKVDLLFFLPVTPSNVAIFCTEIRNNQRLSFIARIDTGNEKWSTSTETIHYKDQRSSEGGHRGVLCTRNPLGSPLQYTPK